MASVGTGTSQPILAIAGAALGLAAVAESLVRLAGTDATTPYALLLCLLAAATTLPVMVSSPLVAAVSVTAAGVLSIGVFDTLTTGGAAAQILVALRLGRSGPYAVALVLGVPYLVFALADRTGSYLMVMSVLLAALAPIAAGAGIASRVGREEKDHRAADHAVADAFLQHTARGERARIARELHDVVAHHISMIAVQSETARLTTPGMPAAGAQRLSAIGDTARAALTEMRRLLGVLREDAQIEVVQRRPQPGLHQLTELLDEARDATGAGTRLILYGPPVPLDPGVELAVYRIVQEALTNSRRHAPGAAVDVELHFTSCALRVLVRDNGPGPTAPAETAGNDQPSPGHGLLGMRERAAAVGGELRAGAAATGGFLVEATLPIGTEDIG
jgi:signal transduction histidine kinase